MSDTLYNYDNKLANEGQLVGTLYKLMNEADILISYNGDNFDRKHVNTALLRHGYMPPTPTKSIDLYKVVKRYFRFSSNKLDFVAQALGVGKKMEHDGFELWRKCMEGDHDAWQKMEEYNRHDIEITEGVYDKVKGWIHNHPNINLYDPDAENAACPTCGSEHVKRNGIEVLSAATYQRYKCTDCGANLRGGSMENTIEERRELFKGVK